MDKPIDNLVYGTCISEGIPFCNPSDAKIAQLVLEDGLPVQTVDLFLDVLRDPMFKPEELTIVRASDVFHRISDFRTQRAITRENLVHKDSTRSPTNTSDYGGCLSNRPPIPVRHFPLLVLELVLDTMLREFESNLKISLHHHSRLYYKKLFWDMSLVHRSWTQLSQRALAHSVKINVARDMRRLLTGPDVGGWTKQLVLYYACYENRSSIPESGAINCLEGYHLTHFIFPRFPCLRYLRLLMNSIRDDDIPIGSRMLREIESSISSLTSLEELSISLNSYTLAISLCSILSKLHHLRTLLFRLIRDQIESDEPVDGLLGALTTLKPGKRLAHVSIEIGARKPETLYALVRWLLQPRGDGEGSIESLCCYGSFTERKQDILDAILSTNQNLSSLELHSVLPNDRTIEVAFLQAAVQKFTNLKRLGICSGVAYLDDILQTFTTVKSIYHGYGCAGWMCQYEEEDLVTSSLVQG